MDKTTLDELIAEYDVEVTPGSGLDAALKEAQIKVTVLENAVADYARRFSRVSALLQTMELEYLTHSEKHGVIKIALRWLEDGQPTTAADEIPF